MVRCDFIPVHTRPLPSAASRICLEEREQRRKDRHGARDARLGPVAHVLREAVERLADVHQAMLKVHVFPAERSLLPVS